MLNYRSYWYCECVQDGITIKFEGKDKMRCCNTNVGCRMEGHNIVCNGTTSSLSDQCHDENYYGPSCNYYPLDEYRYNIIDSPLIFRSYLDLCEDNRYVQHYKAEFTKKFVKKV